MDSTNTRRPCFIAGDDGLASIADMEAGISGHTQTQIHHHQHFISRPLYYTRKTSLRNFTFSSSSSPRSGRFLEGRFEEHQPHFLDSCFLCKKPLGDNKDIFMYRGDTPFCSEECRQEQIETDEAKEKNRNFSSSRKTLRNKNDQNKSTSSPTKKDYAFRSGAVAAA